MAADHSKQASVQENVNEVENEFENLQALIGEKIHHQGELIKLWQQYEDGRQAVQKVLNQVTLITAEDVVCETQAEVKATLDKVKVCVRINTLQRGAINLILYTYVRYKKIKMIIIVYEDIDPSDVDLGLHNYVLIWILRILT